MTIPSPVKTKKNQAYYSTAHIVKRKKMLLGNVACLTCSTANNVIIKCAKNIKIGLAPSYILASLFSGRSVLQLWQAKIAIPPLEFDEKDGINDIGFYIFSNWQHPKLDLPSTYLSLFRTAENDGEILLPLEILPAFQKSQDEKLTFEELKTEIDSFCKQNFVGFYQHVNTSRIQSHFSHCAPKFGLSRADVAFVADYKLEDHPHCSYGLFNTRQVIGKHLEYIHSLVSKACQTGFEVRSMDKKSYFGSYRVLKESSVIAFFDYCIQQINRNPATHAELVQSFNFYTFYVVSFLELCTMHRPMLAEFGKLENFDLIASSVVITDKGEQSSRVIPLSMTACNVLDAYVKYLKNLIRDQRFIYPEVANTITKSLNSEIGLFQYWDNKDMKAYHPNYMYTLVEFLFPFPQNWARHYIATVLLDAGVTRNALEVYMGHAPAPDQIYSESSSFDFDSNRSLSDKIEKHITQELNLPVIILQRKNGHGRHIYN